MGNIFNNKFFEKLLILSWIVFLFICIGLLSFTSHAEESYFPMQQNENGNIPQYIIDYFNDYYSEDYYIVLRWWGHNASFNEDYIYFLMFPKTNDFMLYGEIQNNGYQFSMYNVGTNIGGLSNGYMGFRNGSQSDYWNGGQNISGWQLLNSSLYDSGTDFVSNFKIWTSNNEENRSVVLKYGADYPVIDVGHATHPHFDGLHPHYGNTVTPPDEVPPTYTINNYSWTTYNNPPVDNSSTDALLQSIFDILSYNAGYLQTNISNEFDNLLNNLSGLISYLGETLQYYGDLIIDNIQNGIQNFYDNMVSLVEPIFEKLDYISEPIDGTIIYDNISSTSLITNYNSVNSALFSFKTSFDNLSEPSSFTIPIHLENLPSAYFGNQTTQYIDLGVIGSTEKGLIRTFMWALITYGLFITIVDSVSNYINGGGDES